MPFVKIAINYLQAIAPAPRTRVSRAVPGRTRRKCATGSPRNFNAPARSNPLLPRLRPLAPQLTAYAFTFPLRWPVQLVDIFEAMRRISYPPVQLKAIDCQFSNAEGSIVFERFLLCARGRCALLSRRRTVPAPRRPPPAAHHRRASHTLLRAPFLRSARRIIRPVQS